MAKTFSLFEDSFPSLEVIAEVKIAILLCCETELKREILNTNCDKKFEGCNFWEKKKQIWSGIIEKKTRMMLVKFRLPEILFDKVISAVLTIGIRMLIWAEYHEGTLGFSREFSMQFLNGSLFTPRGMIDNKKAAKELMNVNNLAIHQKYRIACLYCFVDDIPDLFRQMSRDDMEKHTRQPRLVKFWSFYSKRGLGKMKELRNPNMLKKAVEGGNKTSVEYCLTVLKRKHFNIVNTALDAVRNCLNNERDDYHIFDPEIGDKRDSWVPTAYYTDIVFFLLSKMREDKLIEFLQKDIEKIKYRRNFSENDHRVLEYLLRKPYHGNFMKLVNLIWDYLPPRSYGVLLLKICDLIEPRIAKILSNDEVNLYDYRSLLVEFWRQSPKRFKRYVFNKPKKITCAELLEKLLMFKNFTNSDAKIIQLILPSALDKEKKNILAAMKRGNICIYLMSGEKWRILDLLVVNCCSTKEEADKFKRQYIFTEDALIVCMRFVLEGKWSSIESAINWSVLPDTEINKLKKALIDSYYGRNTCKKLVYRDDYETANKFIMDFFTAEEDVKAFKKDIVNTKEVMEFCAKLVAKATSGAVERFIDFFFSSDEEIKKFRNDVANKVGGDFCGRLISESSQSLVLNEQRTKRIGVTINFQGGRWEEIEKFLTWCFPSEKEIYEFKREKIKVLGYILNDLIEACQFEEAEKYFAWLELSAGEINALKKNDFFKFHMRDSFFKQLFYSSDDEALNNNYYHYDFGSNQDRIELLLRWYLTDRETVLEFSGEFKLKYLKCDYKNEAQIKDAFKKFDLAIAQCLSDLEEEMIGIVRKPENSTSSKKVCN